MNTGFEIKKLEASLEQKYEAFLLSSPETLFFASNKYRKLLKHFLNEEDHYFIAIDKSGEVKGALPAFLKKSKTSGNVLNSLPFYGSNGGVIEFENNAAIRQALVDAFYSFAKENNCVAGTIISSPLFPEESFYEKATEYTFKDSRIGQLTPLPVASNDNEKSIMDLIHFKTRNLVRKAQKSGIDVKWEEGDKQLEFLFETHRENLEAIGGISKSNDFFDAIPQHFVYGQDYRIFCAEKDGQLIAAVLLFYFNKTVEYFTPVIKAEFRNLQPLSLLIFEAMKDAVQREYTWWNWGGTWATQDGVYHFKSRWGTQDKLYYYYTKIFNEAILTKSKTELLNEFPYFFVAPFNVLTRA